MGSEDLSSRNILSHRPKSNSGVESLRSIPLVGLFHLESLELHAYEVTAAVASLFRFAGVNNSALHIHSQQTI